MSLLDLAACEPQIDTLPYPSRGLGLGPRRAQRTILILCWQPYYNRVFFARRSGVGAMVMEVVGQEAVGFLMYFMFFDDSVSF